MRSRLALLVALAAVGASAPAAQAKPVVGFADQNASMFSDPRWVKLDIRQVRLNLPWDVLQDPATLPAVDAWMAGAKLHGAAPLVTIDRSRRPGMAGRNPTAATLATQVRRWRVRWPGQVRQISTWNEGNINKRPELVAQWYRAIRRACTTCTILGVDLVDRGNAVSWAKRFVKAAGRTPAVWGLHDYIDANTFKTANTRAFLKALGGRVWLTETGGVVRRARQSVRFSGTGPRHAAKATGFVLKQIARVDPVRIERVYLYSWSSGDAMHTANWDSSMVGLDGKARPALQVVRSFLSSPGRITPPRTRSGWCPPPAGRCADVRSAISHHDGR